MEGTTFRGCSSGWNGGAIFFKYGPLEVKRSLFDGNSAYYGSAVYGWLTGSLTLASSTLHANAGAAVVIAEKNK